MRASAPAVAFAVLLLALCNFPFSQGAGIGIRAPASPESAAFTHSVLAEIFAASPDPASADAESAMSELGKAYGHDFHFVTILTDFYDANGMGAYYSVLAQPTIEFDGGFMEDIGGTISSAGQGGTLAELCAQRPVQIVKMAVFIDEKNITVKMMYEGPPSLPIPLPVEIPAILPFEGHLRAYVCEKNSSLKNANGEPVPNAAVALAFDEDVSLSQGQWAEKTVAHQYGENISNLNVIAGLFEMYGGLAEIPKLSTCVQSACSDETSGENAPPEINSIYTSPKYPAATDSITVYATATDDKKIMGVDITYCQNEVCKSPTPMTSQGNNVYSFSLGVFSDGTKVRFNIRAEDAEGASYQTPEYYFIVGSDNLPPVCEIKSPKGGEKVGGQITIQGTASDDKGLQKVEVKIGELEWAVADGKENWSCAVDTSRLANGPQKARARSYDGEYYSEEHIITLKVAGGSGEQIPEDTQDAGAFAFSESSVFLMPMTAAIIGSAVLLARRRI